MHRSLLACALCALPLALVAQDPEVPEGHSYHGGAFNEGPRQAAWWMGSTGAVHWQVTTSSPPAQRFFDQGLGQLHGFWYLEAERSFRQAAALDPDLAMAYWGMAMANRENAERANGFARQAWARRQQASDLERRHIEALARFHGAQVPLAKDQEGVDKPYAPPKIRSAADGKRRQRYLDDLDLMVAAFPGHVETKAFLVNQIWIDFRYGGRPIPSRQANQALLQQIFAAQPMHPAHHYRIHLWDKQATAHLALDSAARSGPSAPGIAHMWHMAGHIYDQLRRYGDTAWAQEASARVDHAHMIRDRVLPDQIHNFAHNNEWLARSLSKVGRVHDAVDLAVNMVSLPRHPQWNRVTGRNGSTRYGRRRLLETMVQYGLWRELLALSTDGPLRLEPDEDVADQVRRLVALGIARAMTGDADGVSGLCRSLETLELDDDKPGRRGSRSLDNARKALDGCLAFAAGRLETAVELLTSTSIDPIQQVRFLAACGSREQALEKAAKLVGERAGQTLPLALQARLEHDLGHGEEAAASMALLRPLAARADLDAPPFAALAPVATALGLPQDWRLPPPVPHDVGERPPLDSLGPFRWTPPPAPGFRLPAADGTRHTLQSHRGRPVVVLFFLGFGCVHCVEQLQEFAPAHDAFAAAGIDLVTIGSDPTADVRSSLARAVPEDRYPFPILADPELDTFRAWRCFDDFEGQPLHGTFVVDGRGRVRWQDISYQPFMDWRFVLAETQRLLALPEPTDSR